jgi:L-histidine N-alpha-methyltransferase
MSATYQVLTHRDLARVESFDQTFASDVLVGLSQTPKKLSSRYFYDERGSRLFQKIMELPEYYLTACEVDILKSQTAEFSSLIGEESFNLVELGAGDGRKTSILLDHFLMKDFVFQYIPIDISEASMRILTELLNVQFPELTSRGIVAEYFDGLKWLNHMNARRNMVIFLGSNIGNFDKAHSRAFLHNLWNSLNDGDFAVIGFDLKKDIDVMLKAYNDSEGVTADFNLNLLRRINRELGGNFDLNKFQFHSSYDVFTGAMESYLVSKEKQSVFIKEISQSFSFEPWEPIHTEYSYKYLESDIRELAAETGFKVEKQLYDSKKYFVDSIWRVEKISAF